MTQFEKLKHLKTTIDVLEAEKVQDKYIEPIRSQIQKLEESLRNDNGTR